MTETYEPPRLSESPARRFSVTLSGTCPRHGLSDAPQLSPHPKRLVLSNAVHTPAAKGSGGSEMICGSVIKAHQVSLSTSPQGSRRTNHCGSNYFCQLQSASSITIGETLSWADRSAANISSAFGDRLPHISFAPASGPVEPRR